MQKLYLIPISLAEETPQWVHSSLTDTLKECQFFLVENVRTARRFISSLKLGIAIDSLTFGTLNKDTAKSEVEQFFRSVPIGQHIGLMSEAGCPCVGDPGNLAVQYAHQYGIRVVPLVGASSVLLALMASGLNGQNFAFRGYLPIDRQERAKRIKLLEKESAQHKQTQILIETPYRNTQLVEALLATLSGATQLCIAAELTAPTEFVRTLAVSQWREQQPDLHKKPTIYLFQA